MANRWFRVSEDKMPDNDTMTPSAIADFVIGKDIDGFSGTASHPDGPPKWIVRIYADETTLDALASEPGIQTLPDVPVQALNQIFGQNRDAPGWESGFRTGGE